MTDNTISSASGRRTFLITSGTAGLSLTAGCLEAVPGLGSSEAEGIPIAGLQPFTGPFSAWATAHDDGAEFAVEKINENGGVLDEELNYNAIDTEADPSEAATAYATQADEGAIAAIGPVSSDVAVNLAPDAEDVEVPVFLHAAGDVGVLNKDTRYTFRTVLPATPTCGEALAELNQEHGFDNVHAISADYAWGNAINNSLEENIPDAELNIVPQAEDNFAQHMPDSTDFLIGTGHPPGADDMFNDAREAGLEPDFFTAAIVQPAEASYNAVGDEIVHGYTNGHTPDPTLDTYQDIAGEFAEEEGEYFGPICASGYMAINLIAEAIEEAGSTDPVDIADATREIEYNSPVIPHTLQYTEWGELDNVSVGFYGFELEAPDHYEDGEFRLYEEYRTDELEATDPEEWDT